jgi:hypothetical protein
MMYDLQCGEGEGQGEGEEEGEGEGNQCGQVARKERRTQYQ